MIYVIGSLKNPVVVDVANALEQAGHEVFADWFSPGPDADDHWQRYEKARGRTFREALAGPHAEAAFGLDKAHLDRADVGVLVLPCGKSGHLELGYLAGRSKRTIILFPGEPARYDLMYKLADRCVFSLDELLEEATK